MKRNEMSMIKKAIEEILSFTVVEMPPEKTFYYVGAYTYEIQLEEHLEVDGLWKVYKYGGYWYCLDDVKRNTRIAGHDKFYLNICEIVATLQEWDSQLI